MHRIEVINFLIEKYFDENVRYLEIGVADPSACFDHINSKNKTSVDPAIEHHDMQIDYQLTSDTFFEKLENGELKEFPSDYQWDIIFIDGLHLAEQVYKDIQNSLKHITITGFIILHDCNPPSWENAHSDHEYYLNNGGYWNGTTWKAFYRFRTESKYKTYTVDTDQGLGIIETGNMGMSAPHENPWYEYGVFSKNRQSALNLISVEDFITIHNFFQNENTREG